MKTRLLFNTAALLGALAVLWMGLDFIGSNPLALAVTAVIGFVFLLGLAELVQFRAATAGLRSALDAASDSSAAGLETWLGRLHPSLRNAVARRIHGEHVGLPAPVFSPYLVGLLVMLGLLGTFIGMVDTLQGAVIALEGSTELSSIRAGLAAPIQGLGLAFGTSVAGVAASAMLGLNATLSRRERMQVTRQLDSFAGSVFREHSLQYQRQQTYLAVRSQAEVLPQVAQQLAAMAGELENMGNRLAQQLLENQATFHAEARSQYRSLGESVGAHLRDSLAASGRLAGESIAPAVEQTMTRLTEQSSRTHEILLAANQSHLTQLLRERQDLMQELSGLSRSLRETSEEQRSEISEFVGASSKMLHTATAEIRAQLTAEASRLTDMTTHVAGSAAELSSLGESFGLAVQLFSESNQSLVENLSRIEDAMTQSTERSDEQMGYYVAQAREIIDQSMLSQREIIEELRRVGQADDLFAAEAG